MWEEYHLYLTSLYHRSRLFEEQEYDRSFFAPKFLGTQFGVWTQRKSF